jgi:glutamate-1-semialdehyde 2,1-aminomutase
MLRSDKSRILFEKAKVITPSGVHDELRSMRPPISFTRAKGSRIYDVDGNEYVDFHLAFGPRSLEAL